MSKQTKATKAAAASTTAPVAPAPAPVVVTPVVAAPVVQEVATKVKKVREPKQKAATTPAVEAVTASASAPVAASAPAAASASAPAPAAEEVVGEVDTSVNEKSLDIFAKLQQLSSIIASLKTDYRTLDKQYNRELKNAQKASTKRKRKAGNRAPSGFVKPTRISDELAQFLGKQVGAEMARTEVTRDINTYIRTHDLQDKANGRKIIPDSKLSSLLKINQGEELTYFNLQRYMSPHFSKASKPAEATATA
jgi:upstream activation factor subunit UAF30